jgi:hypothetical protein
MPSFNLNEPLVEHNLGKILRIGEENSKLTS